MIRVYWCLDWGPLYGKYPLLGIGNLDVLVSAASLWQAGNEKRLRIPTRIVPRRSMILDSAAFSLLTTYKEYPFSFEKYLEAAEALEVDWVVARDVPCEPFGHLSLSVRERVRATVEADAQIVDAKLPFGAEPLPVIQGWDPADYIECIDLLKERGLLRDFMAVGSCCKRERVEDVLRIARAIRDNLPDRVRLHFFGLKLSVLRLPEFVRIAHSVDTGAWTFGIGNRYVPWDEEGNCSGCGKPGDGSASGHLHIQSRPSLRTDAFWRYREQLNRIVAGSDLELAGTSFMGEDW